MILKNKREYYLKNKERFQISSKKWREENKEYKKEKDKEYNKNNKVKRNERHYKRYNNDPIYCISHIIRGLIQKSFINNKYNKDSKTQEILGCSFEEFKLYLESKFEPWYRDWETRSFMPR